MPFNSHNLDSHPGGGTTWTECTISLGGIPVTNKYKNAQVRQDSHPGGGYAMT